jgi:hypothetical protein
MLILVSLEVKYGEAKVSNLNASKRSQILITSYLSSECKRVLLLSSQMS